MVVPKRLVESSSVRMMLNLRWVRLIIFSQKKDVEYGDRVG